MKMNCRLKKIFCTLSFIVWFKLLFAQVPSCLPNIDFESGDFLNWQCYIGNVFSSGTDNIVNVSATPPIPNRHTIISSAYDGVMDIYGSFPVRCPNGSGNSVKLGNNSSGSQAERISYVFTIPNNQTQYTIVYQYAVVFEDPQHQVYQQPRFIARVYDVATNQYVSCATFDYVATSNLPGFTRSTVDPDVWYKSWTPVSIDLSGYAGQTIILEFTTVDCTLGGHFGYAYVDVNTGCTTPVTGAFYCPGSNSVNLTAPFGYQYYNWYNGNFTQLLGTDSTLVLSPPPPIGTIIALEIVPFSGFGCRDTVLAQIQVGSAPVANAGEDRNICRGEQVNIGSPSVMGNLYSWSPAAGLTNPNSADPIASPLVTTDYFLTVTDFVTGCTSRDTAKVFVDAVPTSNFTINPSQNQCIVGNNFSFSYSNPSNFAILWRFGDGFTSTSPVPSHNYTNPGTYTVTLIATSASGCTDSSSKTVVVNLMPTGSLAAAGTYICEGFPTVLTATGGASYNWYKDGVVIPSNNTDQLNALTPGSYTVEVITAAGCSNFVPNNVSLGFVKKPVADFIYDKYCVELPTNFTNRSNVTGSLPVTYLWSFGNLNTSSAEDPTFTFNTAGNFNVQLSITPQACPQLLTTIQKTIAIEAPKEGVSYNPLNAITNRPVLLKAREFGVDYLWMPSAFLNNSTSPSPVYTGPLEQIYKIRIITAAGCTTVDTQMVRIFKEIDVHVPKAFTPNGDGRNDRMYPFLVGIRELKIFRIINRWGVVVFESKTDLPGWDGTVRGAPQPMDGYSWEVDAIDMTGEILRKRGTFTLIR